jgi:hypothetical protein
VVLVVVALVRVTYGVLISSQALSDALEIDPNG